MRPLQENFTLMNPGERLKYFLNNHKIPIVKAANDLGMNKGQIHKIIRGDSEFRRTVALALQALYGVDAVWLLSSGDSPDILNEPHPMYTASELTPEAERRLLEKEDELVECRENIDALKKTIVILGGKTEH